MSGNDVEGDNIIQFPKRQNPVSSLGSAGIGKSREGRKGEAESSWNYQINVFREVLGWNFTELQHEGSTPKGVKLTCPRGKEAEARAFPPSLQFYPELRKVTFSNNDPFSNDSLTLENPEFAVGYYEEEGGKEERYAVFELAKGTVFFVVAADGTYCLNNKAYSPISHQELLLGPVNLEPIPFPSNPDNS